MALKTKVKAGNITNLSDARYCAGMGVDWLSFPVNLVNPTLFKEITDWVAGPQSVLEVNTLADISLIEQYPVSILEISYQQIGLIEPLSTKTWGIILPISEWNSQKAELIKQKDKIEYLLLIPDSLNLQVVNEIVSHFKVLINQSELHSIDQLLALPIEGINILGDHELKPGLKDYEKLSSVLEELELID